MDVLAKAELAVPGIAEKVRASGFEYADFKITFSISLMAYLNRLRVVGNAEQTLNKDFSSHFNKAAFRGGGNLDFKEVFKWIVSPILARELSIPANLDGAFLVNCIFQRDGPDGEELLLQQLNKEVENPFDRKKGGGSKWRNKRHDKNKKWGDQTTAAKVQLGAEALYKKIQALPKPMIELLPVFREKTNESSEMAAANLNTGTLIENFQVTCSSEALLVKGRYVKLVRNVS